ncbi:MAG: type II toxin-antitoxin system PemK/MazF family toxin [Balneolaceae bacterium]|nr:type II toxin-antitoxin system PemK/MazF family toxin [Balneolaceae bacterium]
MKAGDIVLAELQQSDSQRKLRPVLLLKQFPPFDDWLVCGISSQIRHQVTDFDEVILESDDDFSESGLHVESVIRLGFLATLSSKDLPGTIGKIQPARYERLLFRLVNFLNNEG